MGGAARGGPRAPPAALDAARAARGALAVESVEPEFDFAARGPRHRRSAPSEQTESHRLIEHLMIAANEAVATLLGDAQAARRSTASTSGPSRRASSTSPTQLASLDVPTPPLPEPMSPQQAADAVGEISRLVDEHVRRTGRGRAALTSLVLRSLKQARYSPRNVGHAGLQLAALLPLHLADPPLPRPRLPPRAAGGDRGGRGRRRAASAHGGRGRVVLDARARRDGRSSARADDVARCFLLERELFERGWQTEWDGEVIGVIGAGAFVAFGDGHEGLLPVRRLRGDWWELDELEVDAGRRAVGQGDPARRPGASCRSSASTRRAAASTSPRR